MKSRILSEKSLVIVLFVMVFVIFSLAQEDTKKIEKMYQDNSYSTSPQENGQKLAAEENAPDNKKTVPATPLR